VRKANLKAEIFVELDNPGHRLLKYAPKDLVVVSSNEIMETILKGEKLNPLEWRKEKIIACR